MKRYYVVTIIQDEDGRIWTCAQYDPCLDFEKALEIIELQRRCYDRSVVIAYVQDEKGDVVWLRNYLNVIGIINREPVGKKELDE